MGRSSRLTTFAIFVALLPASASAQLYGFPSDVGVIDDGFGVLPPEPLAVQPGFGPPPPPPYLPAQAVAPTPCPLVIEIGRGLKRATKTRVTYGRPACS